MDYFGRIVFSAFVVVATAQSNTSTAPSNASTTLSFNNFTAAAGTASFQYVTNSSLPANITTSCAAALMGEIACDPWISNWQQGQYYDPDGLQSVCSSSCASALQTYESNLVKNCGDQLFNYTEVTYLPVSALGSRLIYLFDLICLQDSGRYCNYVAYGGSLANNPDAPALFGTPNGANATVSPCDDCLVKQLNLQAGSPFGGGSDLASAYSSLTKSCSKTGLPLSTTTISSSTSALPTPSSTCKGKTYHVQSSDTCRSIAEAQGISVGWLVLDNPNTLNAYCANFTATGSLCIQDTCNTYAVKQNDTCASVAAAKNTTQAQLISWNPILNPSCNNLNSSVGDTICVGKPGQPYTTTSVSIPVATSFSTAAPVPTDVAEGTNENCGEYYKVVPNDYCNLVCLKFGITLGDLVFLNPAINENCTNLFAEESYCVAPVGNINDYPGHAGYIPPTSSIPSSVYSSFPTATYVMPPLNVSTPLPIANGTRSGCELYVDGSALQQTPNGTYFTSACALWASSFDITLAELQNWNPSLNTNSTDCSFNSSAQYCITAYNSSEVVEPVNLPPASLPLRDGTLTNCTNYADADEGVDCATILLWSNITIAQFYSWNPEVKADCSALWTGYSYCVSMNDDSGNDGPGSSLPTASPTSGSTTGTPTAFPTTAGPPGPTQSGQPANCVQWALVQSGDTCSSIEEEYLISDAQFHKWNPAVSADCTQGFWAGEAFCVGTSDDNPSRSSSSSASVTPTSTQAVPSPTVSNSIISSCNKYAEAMSGDYCSMFAQDNGITTGQLYTWNSALGPDGENCGTEFFAGYYYCVGVSTS